MGAHRSATRSAPISFSTAGDQIIIAAPSNGPINVYALFFTVSGATNMVYKDGFGNILSGPIIFTANGSSQTLPLVEEPWYQVAPGGSFIINSSSPVTVGGTIWYTVG